MKLKVFMGIQLCFILISTSFVKAEELKQTIKGVVIDKESQTTLPGATIVIKGTDLESATITDPNGRFFMPDIPIGRYTVEFRFLGYTPLIIPEVQVTSGKEVVLKAEMTESLNTINEVIVKAHSDKDRPLNSMASVSARSFNVEETRRYAGGMDDPARLASVFAGVTSGGNNQDNAIVIRGNAPKTVLWRIEGVDIPNPNHFSGGNVAGGGFVTTISSQMLANSDFYTGAFPAEYGNALGGVFDIKLRSGNTDKHEKTIQLGILGIDLSAEGPLSRKNNSSYLFNYRYSTFGLLSNLGMMPTDQTPVYQDLSFKFVFPTKRTGTFSLWGIGGIDDITDKAEYDSILWETDYDRMNNDWDEAFGAIGIKNKYTVNNKTFINTSLAVTGDIKKLTQQRLDNNLVLQNDIDIHNNNGKISLNTFVNYKIKKSFTSRTGFSINKLFYNYNLNGTENSTPGTYKNYTSDFGYSYYTQVYTELKYNLSNTLNLIAGLHCEYFALNEAFTIDPRISFNWNYSPNQSLSIGYGKHSQLEDLNIYFIEIENNGEKTYPNKKLDFSHSHHFVLGYNYRINDNLRIKIEPYFQYLYNIPGIENSSFSMINFKQDLTFQEELNNNSIGKNMGCDITLERFLKNNFYYLITASVFDSKYKADDKVWRNTRYNKQYVANILAGKEFVLGAAKNKFLGINMRGVISGGNYYTPILEEASSAAQQPVYDETNAFSKKEKINKFVNLSLTYRINKQKYSSVFAIQLNNVLKEPQYGEYEYNYIQKTCIRSSEVYSLPSISYKLEF